MIIKNNNLILIGYRGVGKSSLAVKLADRLKFNLFQSDSTIEMMTDTSIKNLVKLKGWDHFRTWEKKILLENLHLEKTVFDLGGGAIEQTQVMEKLKQNSVFCLIEVEKTTLYDRLKNSPDRPRLENTLPHLEEFETTLARRLPLYERYADFKFTNDQPIQKLDLLVEKIIQTYQKIAN